MKLLKKFQKQRLLLILKKPNESSEAAKTIEEVFDETILEESPKAKTVDEEAELMALKKKFKNLNKKKKMR